MKGFLLVCIGMFVVFAVILYISQGKLIYLPQRYSPKMDEFKRVDSISYLLGGKKQFLYVPHRINEELPEQIWWVFGGNGSVALGWVGAVEAVSPKANRAFVLFDYPGYGLNEGEPNPERIAKSLNLAIPEVAKHLGFSEGELIARSSTLGHSLGSAVAFDFADRYGLDRVIAISPFTTMAAMARKQMGPVISMLLSHRYDNEKSLDAILNSNRSADITIFHGSLDSLIPVSMGKALADRDKSGERVKFISVPGAGHNDIVMRIAPDLIRMVAE
jgi:pimeloyl-ACP methyl ester carboxylesterase